MTEIWILFYVITTGSYSPGDTITSGTIEFGSAEACKVAANKIRGTRGIDTPALKCIPSGRFLEVPGAKQKLAEMED